MWLLLAVALLLLPLAVVLWPGRDQVWHMHCTGCQWSADLSGPDDMVIGAAHMIADGHMERTGHQPVNVEEKRR